MSPKKIKAFDEKRFTILVLHCYHSEFPVRSTTADFLASFARYSACDVFYFNAYFSALPQYLRRINWDLIIFTDLFVLERTTPASFQRVIAHILPLKHTSAVKILIPQDEYIHTDSLCDLVNDFSITIIFSNAEESEWKHIYRNVNSSTIKFFRVLCGYLDEKTLYRIEKIEREVTGRDIDIGYRSKVLPFSLGKFGALKSKIARIFLEKALQYGHTTNISVSPHDTLLGDRWYLFLLRCKYTIGVEGGSSILDHQGTIRACVEQYRNRNPRASFEDVELECFSDKDGTFRFHVISPRHLEACATKTCQILIEGTYNGILIPHRHYIPLKKDFSNIDEVLSGLSDEKGRLEIVENAYQDIVASGKYTFRSFVCFVLNASLGGRKPNVQPFSSMTFSLYLLRNRIEQAVVWMCIAILWYCKNIIRKTLRIFFSEEKSAVIINRLKQYLG